MSESDESLLLLHERAKLHNSEENYKDAIEIAGKGLQILAHQERERADPAMEFALRFERGVGFWHIDQDVQAFDDLSICLSLCERDSSWLKDDDLKRGFFAYMFCVYAITRIKLDRQAVDTLFLQVGKLIKGKKNKHFHTMKDHLYSQTLLRLGFGKEALQLAEQALASMRLASKHWGCELSCYIRVYVGILAEIGKFDLAHQVIDEALAQGRDEETFLEAKGNLYFVTKEYDKAHEYFSLGITLATDKRLYLPRAQISWLMGNFKEAEEDCRIFLQHYPARTHGALWHAAFSNNNSHVANSLLSRDCWQQQLCRFWMGELSHEQLLIEAKMQPLAVTAQAEALFFGALLADMNQQHQIAVELYEKALCFTSPEDKMHNWAKLRHANFRSTLLDSR